MSEPIVAAIMPTRGRQKWAQQAVVSFIEQDYSNKHLYILDDDDDPSFPLWMGRDNMTRLLTPLQHGISYKRNVLVQSASDADIIMHWDSDDWSAPHRMSDQVQRLNANPWCQLTGYYKMCFYDERTDKVYVYENDEIPPYAIGTSFAYRRPWALEHPFDLRWAESEDYDLLNRVKNDNVVTSVDGMAFMVARVHHHNTSIKDVEIFSESYKPALPSVLPAGFLALLNA